MKTSVTVQQGALVTFKPGARCAGQVFKVSTVVGRIAYLYDAGAVFASQLIPLMNPAKCGPHVAAPHVMIDYRNNLQRAKAAGDEYFQRPWPATAKRYREAAAEHGYGFHYCAQWPTYYGNDLGDLPRSTTSSMWRTACKALRFYNRQQLDRLESFNL